MTHCLQNSWVVGVNDNESAGRELIFLKGLEDLETAIEKKKGEVESFKPECAMIGMDREGAAIESYPADIDESDPVDEEGATEEASDATDEGLVMGELDDSTGSNPMAS